MLVSAAHDVSGFMRRSMQRGLRGIEYDALARAIRLSADKIACTRIDIRARRHRATEQRFDRRAVWIGMLSGLRRSEVRSYTFVLRK